MSPQANNNLPHHVAYEQSNLSCDLSYSAGDLSGMLEWANAESMQFCSNSKLYNLSLRREEILLGVTSGSK